MNKNFEILEFDKILQQLSNLALSDKAKETLLSLTPFLNEDEVKRKMNETTEAKLLIQNIGTPPLPIMKELNKIISLVNADAMLLPEQLSLIAQFLTSLKRIKSYLKRGEYLNLKITSYGYAINDLEDLAEEINNCIKNGIVDNNASKELKNIRRKIDSINNNIKIKLENMLQSKKVWFADNFISNRNGHYTLPVKREYKHLVSGTVYGTSQSGSTYFIEPSVVSKYNSELSDLRIEEDNEIRKILYALTALVSDYISVIDINIDCIETLDVLFAKGKLSIDMNAVPVEVLNNRVISIHSGRHPLLNAKDIVPLDFEIGLNSKHSCNGIVITGPNTGGKTVALKTIGLLSLMAQSGLHVPVESGSEFSMNNMIFCDIGDGQSITENLSTFSSHIKNIIEILKSSNEESIILLDELGSGTDPFEGMGIAISILNELLSKNCLFIATTHYPEVKNFANNTTGIINARMSFDRQSLEPLFKLEIGQAGESCALYIAKMLGFPNHMLKNAYDEAYKSNRESINTDIPLIEELFDTHTKTIKSVDQLPAIQKKTEKKVNNNSKSLKFKIGDSVMVFPQKKIGIVYQSSNDFGEIGVQIQKKKQLISYKRIKLIAPASKLYPPDYDFSIVFDSVDTRKKRHTIDRKHDPNIVIEIK